MMQTIIKQLQRQQTFLLASHIHPDGDAIGSVLALGLALKAMDKKVRLFNPSPIPAVYRFLPSVHEFEQALEPDERFDAALILDCGDIDRIGAAAVAVCQNALVINIDHHITNTRFGDLQLIDVNACATAEIIYRLIQQLPVRIDYAMATAIYTGILTDTGSFRFSNTNRSAFAICEKMIAMGADPYQVARHVYGTYSLGRIKLLNLALDSLEISPNGKLSVMTLSQRMLRETGTKAEDIDGIINYARRIEDVKVAALIHEVGDSSRTPNGRTPYHVSLRSDSGVDVAKIAAQFGGGGHAEAAGFSIDTSLTDLKKRLMNLSEAFSDACEVT